MISRLSAKVLCTLGPASLTRKVIVRLSEAGVSLFRINMSHTSIEDLVPTLAFIRKHSPVPICIDLEGAQVRTGRVSKGGVDVKDGMILHLAENPPSGAPPSSAEGDLSIYPSGTLEKIVVGDLISIDFNEVLVQAIGKADSGLTVRVLSGGSIGSNKAVTVHRDIFLPMLTLKDKQALDVGLAHGVRHVALSFAQSGDDVEVLRKIVGFETKIISKIESLHGFYNLNAIALKSDALLIDRGDLSREIPIEKIPLVQKHIIRQGIHAGREVYVATNLLESMISQGAPTRAEVNDVINTLLDGASGLVLAAETAIGKDPVGCVDMIQKLINEASERDQTKSFVFDVPPLSTSSSLIVPHGGNLVQRVIEESKSSVDSISKLKRIETHWTDRLDCEQIGVGTYSPLTGFMDQAELQSVLDDNHLLSGEPWTMPVILQVSSDQVKKVNVSDRVALCGVKEDRSFALMDVSQVYKINVEEVCKKWFGTTSPEHPGVKHIVERGEWCIAGDITLVEKVKHRHYPYFLTPKESRFLFNRKKWTKVIGFHTRNVVHGAHEHIQRVALEKTDADGLYITPLVGVGKKGDFLPQSVLNSYESLMHEVDYPSDKVVLGSFMSYPRFSGPREAVFTALCRKNMGCSHFIIGRNHGGVGDYYADSDYKRLFEDLGEDIGIEPLFFDEIGYDPKTCSYKSVSESKSLKMISGTQARASLLKGHKLPSWFMREAVQESLCSEILQNRSILYE